MSTPSHSNPYKKCPDFGLLGMQQHWSHTVKISRYAINCDDTKKLNKDLEKVQSMFIKQTNFTYNICKIV